MTRPRSDPSALRLVPQPTGSGVHRVAVLQPRTLEPGFASVSDDSEPTVVLFTSAAIQHRARLAAKAAADRARSDRNRARLRVACWLGAACLVVWFAARVIAELVPVIAPEYFAAFAVVAVGGFGFLFFCIGDE